MLEAVGKNIVVNPVYAKEKKTIILYMPTDDQPLYYEVISVGSEVKYIKVGDKILLSNYGIQEKDYLEEKIYLTTEDHVFAKVTG